MNILKIEWKTHFKSLLVWSAVVAIVLGIFMAFFPSMQSSAMQDLVNTKMNALPKEMMSVLHINSMADLTKIDAYFAYVFQYIFIAACVYAAMMGAQALVKEETDGTIEFLYAQPITRSELVAWKMVGNAISFLAFWAITFVISAVLVIFLKQDGANTSDLMQSLGRVFTTELLVAFVFMSAGFCFSAIVRSAKQATPVGLALVFITYILGILSGLNDTVDFFQYASPINFAIPSDRLTSWMDSTDVWISVGALVVFVTLTFVLYKKKDLKV
ncbi:ABC transporter permease [Listeria booriae]|uniref:ABC transporter permease n=1 Tax=Listeria booriae TaxID=1552123 RepID=UPI0016246FB9|nr:ABC transporter permease [Listeria booriae]MBC2023097.1 ABC transporter permease [Listeria booriae]MBC2097599.1 ABC transporter permease [Listeria booriae]MBC2146883.1 ABC transporter permease [Listeria booriae]MBC2194613.1 ABC transporter permease [Listeria booriae]MBC2315438.1 ABC transporter permease [Listeria booriae]